jgi:transcriptional regulator with XRE-family HTH domain
MLREQQNPPMTQMKLAVAAHVDPTFISLIESGSRLPSIPVVLTIAGCLGVTPADLLAFDMNDPRDRLLDATRRGDRGAVREALGALGLR